MTSFKKLMYSEDDSKFNKAYLELQSLCTKLKTENFTRYKHALRWHKDKKKLYVKSYHELFFFIEVSYIVYIIHMDGKL